MAQLIFTPTSPYTDGQSVVDQHGRTYTYSSACNTLEPATAAASSGHHCGPCSDSANGLIPAGTTSWWQEDMQRLVVRCSDAEPWIAASLTSTGGGTTVNAPCPTASTEAGNFPTANTAPVTPPAAPAEGQQHFETWDDVRVTWAYCNGAWTKIDEMTLGGGGGGGGITFTGTGGSGQVSGGGSGEWTGPGVSGGTITTVTLVAVRPDGTYGRFTLTLDDSAGA